MCNLYSMTKGRAAVVEMLRAIDRNNNQPPMPGVYPDYAAPVVVQHSDGAREMSDMRWGMPSPKNVIYEAASKRADKLRTKGGEVDFNELLRMEPDKGVTNVRNTSSSHWRPWLGRLGDGRTARGRCPWNRLRPVPVGHLVRCPKAPHRC